MSSTSHTVMCPSSAVRVVTPPPHNSTRPGNRASPISVTPPPPPPLREGVYTTSYHEQQHLREHIFCYVGRKRAARSLAFGCLESYQTHTT